MRLLVVPMIGPPSEIWNPDYAFAYPAFDSAEKMSQVVSKVALHARGIVADARKGCWGEDREGGIGGSLLPEPFARA